MTYAQWLRRFLDSDTPTGDLARDVEDDSCLTARTPGELREHIVTAHPGHNGPALHELAVSHAHQRKRGSWWVECLVCPPHPSGAPRLHYEHSRNAKARQHLAAMKARNA